MKTTRSCLQMKSGDDTSGDYACVYDVCDSALTYDAFYYFDDASSSSCYDYSYDASFFSQHSTTSCFFAFSCVPKTYYDYWTIIYRMMSCLDLTSNSPLLLSHFYVHSPPGSSLHDPHSLPSWARPLLLSLPPLLNYNIVTNINREDAQPISFPTRVQHLDIAVAQMDPGLRRLADEAAH